MNTKPIALSFFSGALGLDQGIEQAGFDIRLACEFNKYCQQTIALNKPNLPVLGDISDYPSSEILYHAGNPKDVDLIIGGPPCQAFSTAGKRNGFNDTRGNAFLTFLNIAFEIRPKFLVIENVRGLLSCPLASDGLSGGVLNLIISIIKSNRYSFSFQLYNAANFGVPQNRERVVIICQRDGDTPPYLIPTHSDDGVLEKFTTFREATYGIINHQFLNFPEKRLKYLRMLTSGQNWKNLPVELQKEALGNSYFSGGGKTGFLRRLAWDSPAPTLVTHPAMPATNLAHPEADRPLSIEEYKRLQQFPDTWKLAGPLREQYKQIGNAVPVGLGIAIGSLVIKLLNSETVISPTDFQYSRYKNTNEHDWLLDFQRRSKLGNIT